MKQLSNKNGAYTATSLETRIRNLSLGTLWANTRDSFVDKHLGFNNGQLVTNSDLVHRCVTTKKDASCFTIHRDAVLLYVQEAMYNDMDAIVDWVNDMSDGQDWEVYYDSDTPIGKGFYQSFNHTWNAGACECSTIKVVLRKTYDADEFRVVTVYPVPTEEEKQECLARSRAYDAEHVSARGVKGRAKLYA